MKPVSYTSSILLSVICTQLLAQTLTIVSTIPDFGSIASEIGGDFVKIKNLCRGTEDPHFVDPRPSYVRLLRDADLLLEGGLGLEEGWLPPLVQNSRNNVIRPGGRGYLNMSTGITLLEVPEPNISRAEGDVHPYGNPHYWLDPTNGRIMAEQICKKLCELDPSHSAIYKSNLAVFNNLLDRKLQHWTQRLSRLKGTRIVTYHKSFEYFASWSGLEIVGTLEPKPGIEPTPGHTRSLIKTMQQTGTKLILIENFRPHKIANNIASRVGGKVVSVPVMVGGEPNIYRYFDLFDVIIDRLVTAHDELTKSAN